MNRELELTYEVYPAAMMLEDILSQADETVFVNGKEASGFLEIGANLLFYTNDSMVGPGHIWLETQEGGTEEIVRFSRPIMAVDILQSTRQFVVTLANLVHSEGWQGDAYTIHFEENALELFSTFPVFHNPSVQDTLYQGNWYRQQTTLAEGELPSLFLVEKDGSLKELKKNGTGFAFANGNIYFLDKTMKNLVSIGINSENSQNIYTFSSPIQGNFTVNQNRILYYQDGKTYIAPLNDMANSQELPVEFSGVRHAMEPDIIWGYSKDTSCVYIWPYNGRVKEYPLSMDIGMPKILHNAY